MAKYPIRVLVVEDFEPFRAFVMSTLAQHPELQVIRELSDGLEAVAAAAELQPDLILLDIGLPSLNGIAAARRIREHSPQSKILFVSGDLCSDVVEEAFSIGAAGYLVKADAGRQLLVAIGSVLQGKNFLSSSLSGQHVNHNRHQHDATCASLEAKQFTQRPANGEIPGRHEAVFYSDDRQLLDHLSRFVGAALNAGNAAVVVATGAHREGLLHSLQAGGVDIAAALEQGRYIAVDVDELLSSCMLNGTLDPDAFLQGIGQLILKALSAVKTEQPLVAVFGEGPDILWKQGNTAAAIQDEKLGNQLAEMYAVDILCGYSVNNLRGVAAVDVLQQICAEHSAVYSR